ncbi:MAG: hypothetical protein JNJ88_01430 [Planctomycetes bacterium]|nr:hypothetical protein [Planctomycetota bacterium]
MIGSAESSAFDATDRTTQTTMAKQYTDEAVVRIWQNHKRLGFIPKSHVGHAAISLRSAIRYLVSDNISYISWWPDGDGASFRDAFKKLTGVAAPMGHRGDQAVEVGEYTEQGLNNYISSGGDRSKLPPGAPFRNPGTQFKQMAFTDDEGNGVLEWARKPDAKVYLPGFQAQGTGKGGAENLYCHWGLSLQRMAFFWRDFQKKQPYFQLGSRTSNCSGVAAQALAAGGATAYVAAPRAVIYMEPLMIERWAEQLAERIAKLNIKTSEFRADCDIYIMSHMREFAALDPNPDDLWSLDHWKKVSSISFAVRSPAVRKIDSALATYHTKTWSKQFPEKLTAMREVFEGILAHREEKPDSRRQLAMFGLGKHVLNKLKAKSLLYSGCDAN